MKSITIILAFLTTGILGFSQAKEFEPHETVYIGPGRDITSLSAFFKNEQNNVHVIIDAGTYYSENEIWISGENIIIEGNGLVHIFCTELYSNIMWVCGNNIIVKNLHMKHFKPGEYETQNCSGRVIGFDGADNITIENCDLNGCGLAGLHDNMGNTNILVKDCYIHNNSLGAYTDIDGGVWQAAADNHPVFKFENNRIENNGPDRVPEDN